MKIFDPVESLCYNTEYEVIRVDEFILRKMAEQFESMNNQFKELREQNAAINGQLAEMRAENQSTREETRDNFQRVDARFAQMETKMDDGFERVDNKIDSLTRRVVRLDDKVDRNYETLLDGFHGAFENLAEAVDKKADAQ